MDISTYCNAGCPQCHRTNNDNIGKKADWLPLIQWHLNDFKKAFPKEQIDNIKEFHFCGTWGDPVMNRDIFEILKYICDTNDYTRVSIDTNGSLRNEDFWWNIGVAFGERLRVVFAIDGINQEMHNIYRRYTSLDKILSNMEILSKTQAKAHSQTIIFKHNENYIEEIKQLAYAHGSKSHVHVISDRFNNIYNGVYEGDKRKYKDENGKEFFLERANNKKLKGGSIDGLGMELSKNVSCRWALPRNEVVINPDGQVLPCCFHANRFFYLRTQTNKEKYEWEMKERFNSYYDNYIDNLQSYNVFHTSLSKIMKSDFFTETLPKSIQGDNPAKLCIKNCSNRTKNKHQFRLVNETA